MNSVPLIEKQCSKCGETKPLEAFGRRKNGKDGRLSACRECQNRADREYYAANPEKQAAAGLKWQRANPKKHAALVAAWRLANPERQTATDAAWRLANPEKRAASMAKWQRANPDRTADNTHRRRARVNALPSERVLLSELVKRDNSRCQICSGAKGTDKWSIDHILPISRGGAHTYANTQLAHLACNARRGNRGTAQLRMIG